MFFILTIYKSGKKASKNTFDDKILIYLMSNYFIKSKCEKYRFDNNEKIKIIYVK